MSKSNKNSSITILKSTLIFTAFYIIVTIIFTLLSSLILLNTEDPLAFIEPVSKGISLISTFIVGFALAKRLKGKYLLCGTILGISIACVLLAFSLVIKNDNSFNPIIYIATIIVSALGCFFGRKREKHKKKKFRRK